MSGQSEIDVANEIYTLGIGKIFYTSNSDLKDLRTEISNYLMRSQKVHYDLMNEILVTVGGSEAIDIRLRAIINAGDNIIQIRQAYN